MSFVPTLVDWRALGALATLAALTCVPRTGRAESPPIDASVRFDAGPETMDASADDAPPEVDAGGGGGAAPRRDAAMLDAGAGPGEMDSAGSLDAAAAETDAGGSGTQHVWGCGVGRCTPRAAWSFAGVLVAIALGARRRQRPTRPRRPTTQLPSDGQ